LFLSGAGVATQRAYIMLAIFFLAILLDRPAITMRNVFMGRLIGFALAAPCGFASRISNEFFCRHGFGCGL
jgi:predicted membrane metal-binding protein